MAADQAFWPCKVCTFHNTSLEAPVCEVCGTAREANADVASAAITPTDARLPVAAALPPLAPSRTLKPVLTASEQGADASYRTVHECAAALLRKTVDDNARAIRGLLTLLRARDDRPVEVTQAPRRVVGLPATMSALPARDVSGLPAIAHTDVSPADIGHAGMTPARDAAGALLRELELALRQPDLQFLAHLLLLLVVSAECVCACVRHTVYAGDVHAPAPPRPPSASPIRTGVRLPTGEIQWSDGGTSPAAPDDPSLEERLPAVGATAAEVLEVVYHVCFMMLRKSVEGAGARPMHSTDGCASALSQLQALLPSSRTPTQRIADALIGIVCTRSTDVKNVPHRRALEMVTYLATILDTFTGDARRAALPQVPPRLTDAQRLGISPLFVDKEEVLSCIGKGVKRRPVIATALQQMTRCEDTYDATLRLHSSRYRVARLLRVCVRDDTFREVFMTADGVAAVVHAVVAFDASQGDRSPAVADAQQDAQVDAAITRVLAEEDMNDPSETRLPEDLVFCLWEATIADPQALVDAITAPTSAAAGALTPIAWLTSALYHPNIGVSIGAALVLSALSIHPTSKHLVKCHDHLLTALSQLHPAMLQRVGRQNIGPLPAEREPSFAWLRLMAQHEHPGVQLTAALVLAIAAGNQRRSATLLEAWMPTMQHLAASRDPFVFSCMQWMRHASKLPLAFFSASRAAATSPQAPDNSLIVVLFAAQSGDVRMFAHALTLMLQGRRFSRPAVCCTVETLNRHVISCAAGFIVVISSAHSAAAGTDGSVWIKASHELRISGKPLRSVLYPPVHHSHAIVSALPTELRDGLLEDMEPSNMESAVEALLQGMPPVLHDAALPLDVPGGAILRHASSSVDAGMIVLPVVPCIAAAAEQVQVILDLQSILTHAEKFNPVIRADFAQGLRSSRSVSDLLKRVGTCEVLHFTGHGDPAQPLHFSRRTTAGVHAAVSMDVNGLVRAFSEFSDLQGPRIVVLMGCYTARLAYLLAAGCPGCCTIGWATALSDAAATRFCDVLYEELFGMIGAAIHTSAFGKLTTDIVPACVDKAVQRMKAGEPDPFAFIDPAFPWTAIDPSTQRRLRLLPATADGRVALPAGVPACFVPSTPQQLFTQERWGRMQLWARGAADGEAFVLPALDGPLQRFDCRATLEAPGAAAQPVPAVIACLLGLDFDYLERGMTPATCKQRGEHQRLVDFVLEGVWSHGVCPPRTCAHVVA